MTAIKELAQKIAARNAAETDKQYCQLSLSECIDALEMYAKCEWRINSKSMRPDTVISFLAVHGYLTEQRNRAALTDLGKSIIGAA